MMDWEEKGGLFKIPLLCITVRDVLFSPTEAFRGLKDDKKIFNAFLFSLICGSVGFLSSSFWQSLVDWSRFLPGDHAFSAMGHGPLYWLAMVCIAPCVTGIFLFIGAAAIHLCLLLTGAGKKGYPVTFRIVAYASGATALFSLIPILGMFAGFVWFVVLVVIGVREAHGNTLARSLFAVFLPMFLCFALFALVIAAAIFFGVLGLAGLMGALR
jgi:hypothetical protein